MNTSLDCLNTVGTLSEPLFEHCLDTSVGTAVTCRARVARRPDGEKVPPPLPWRFMALVALVCCVHTINSPILAWVTQVRSGRRRPNRQSHNTLL